MLKNIFKKLFYRRTPINLSYRDNFNKLKNYGKKDLIRLCIKQSEEIARLKTK